QLLTEFCDRAGGASRGYSQVHVVALASDYFFPPAGFFGVVVAVAGVGAGPSTSNLASSIHRVPRAGATACRSAHTSTASSGMLSSIASSFQSHVFESNSAPGDWVTWVLS